MTLTFGHFLRQLRLARGLSQAQAAQASGIGRVTLVRWEKGAQKPRGQEIEALLRVLSATPGDFQIAFSLLGTISERALLEPAVAGNLKQKDSVKPAMGQMPHRGHWLRALRLRRGLDQEEASLGIGVTPRTLRRWETSEVEPSLVQLHSLCYFLEAFPAEVMALTTGQLPSLPGLDTASIEELRAFGHRQYFYADDNPEIASQELSFLMLEYRIWPFALNSDFGRQVLAEIYSYHAHYLSTQKRFVESNHYANQALDLWPKAHGPNTKVVMAAITAANCAVYRGSTPAPQRGLEVLGYWLEAAIWPEYCAWILSDMAEYLVRSGDYQNGLNLVDRSITVAAQCDNIHELYNRELDKSTLLLCAGQPRQALKLIQKERPHPFTIHPAKFALLESEAYLCLGERSNAHDCFKSALKMIEDGRLTGLQTKLQKLSRQF